MYGLQIFFPICRIYLHSLNFFLLSTEICYLFCSSEDQSQEIYTDFIHEFVAVRGGKEKNYIQDTQYYL